MSEIPKKGKVLVKVSATWCQPCKMLARTIDAADLKIPIIEVDIDDSPEIAQQYNVRGVPTLIIVDNGDEIKRKVGMLTKEQLLDFVQ